MRWRSLVLLPVLLAGCLPPRGSSAITLNYYGRRYCTYSDGYHSNLSYHNSVSRGLEPAIALRQLMCSDHADGDYSDWAYGELDPEAPDPLMTAFMIVHCVATGVCGPVDLAPGGTSVGHTADLYRYARDLDRAAVERALEQVEAPPEVKATFLDRLAACQGYIVQAVFEMNPRLRAVYADTIDRTLADYRAMRRDLAEVDRSYAELRPRMDEALLNESFNDDLHDRVRAVRDAAVLSCTQSGARSLTVCANGPIAHPLTEFLVRSAAALEQHAEAFAEQRVLMDLPDTTDERYAIHLAVSDAMRRESTMAREHRAASERLRESDPRERERLLSEQFGSPPPIDLSEWDNGVGIAPPGGGTLVHGLSSVREIEGRIVRARRRGGDMVVDLELARGSYGGYTASAEARYAIPFTEGEHLEPGELVVLAAEGERARIIRVHDEGTTDGFLLQVRGIRVPR